MTIITDQQRREVAERLRKLTPWNTEGDTDVGEVLTALGMVYGYTDTDLDLDSVHALADLIDRPTCRVESAERWETAGCGRGVDYELSCGHAVTLGECDELRYCPACGAEVTE